MSDWNKELPTYKAKKNGEIDVRPVGGGRGKKPKKLWSVVAPWPWGKKEYVAYRAATKELCDAWIDKKRRGYFMPRRNAPEVMHEQARARQERRMAAYRIVGPGEPAAATQGER